LKYKNIDLTADSIKGYSDLSTHMHLLGSEPDSFVAQQKLALLNHQVILQGLKKLNGLHLKFDKNIAKMSAKIDDTLATKKTSYVLVFMIHILLFTGLLYMTVSLGKAEFSLSYILSTIAMGCATGVLNLMLLREKEKNKFNRVFILLEDEEIDNYCHLHKKLAKIINDNDNIDEKIVEKKLLKEINTLF